MTVKVTKQSNVGDLSILTKYNFLTTNDMYALELDIFMYMHFTSELPSSFTTQND